MWNTDKPNETPPPPYPPPSVIPTYPAMARAEEPEGWCQKNNKNKPQSNSAGAGIQHVHTISFSTNITCLAR